MNTVSKLRVCHFSYVTLVTEGALIIFFPEKKRQGALIGAGVLNGANTVSLEPVDGIPPNFPGYIIGISLRAD